MNLAKKIGGYFLLLLALVIFLTMILMVTKITRDNASHTAGVIGVQIAGIAVFGTLGYRLALAKK
jgi:hypothetical protein